MRKTPKEREDWRQFENNSPLETYLEWCSENRIWLYIVGGIISLVVTVVTARQH